MAKESPYADLPENFKRQLLAVKGRRAKTVIEHILKFGFITTEDLSEKYGYKHPPRAVRDVKEQGIPLEMYRVKGSSGRSIAAYKFVDLSKVRGKEFAGRRTWPKNLKQKLAEVYGQRCEICFTLLTLRYLQIDHRIPYEVAGEPADTSDINNYMLICSSCNRAKSWSCEHCKNRSARKITTCKSCYWASPAKYKHITLQKIRRLDITWTGTEVSEYERLLHMSKCAHRKFPDFVKDVLRRALTNRSLQ